MDGVFDTERYYGARLSEGGNTIPIIIGQNLKGDIDSITIYNYIISPLPTPTPTVTPIPTLTPTPTITPRPTPTPTPTPTPSLTPTPTITPSPIPTPTPTPPQCPHFDQGDANCDKIVDLLDYGIWWDNYGPGEVADFNGDGNNDLLDYGILLDNYGLGS